VTEAISLPPTSRLEELEAIVDKGLASFIEVGTALREIHDERLYGDGSFASYCERRFRIKRFQGYRLIQSVNVQEMLPAGNTLPSERVARELAVLKNEPEKMAAAYQRAQDATPLGKQVTGPVVKEAVRGVKGESQRQPIALHPVDEFKFSRDELLSRDSLDVGLLADAICEIKEFFDDQSIVEFAPRCNPDAPRTFDAADLGKCIISLESLRRELYKRKYFIKAEAARRKRYPNMFGLDVNDDDGSDGIA
jgi:hypothetical protein